MYLGVVPGELDAQYDGLNARRRRSLSGGKIDTADFCG